MIDPSSQALLRQIVGEATFARGFDYVRRGAVLHSQRSKDGTRMIGAVRGGERAPYQVAVRLGFRSETRRLASFSATCTCPVGLNCKHAVALVLSEDVTGPATAATGPALTLVRGGMTAVAPTSPDRSRNAVARPAWDAPLRALLSAEPAADTERGAAGSSELALQFDLLLGAPRPDRGHAADARLLVRPVMPGRNGGWVRTGISWSRLDYFSYGRPRSQDNARRLALVKELVALARAESGRYSNAYSDDPILLESVSTRRLWDLLLEARDIGLPLLQAGRKAEPVVMHRTAGQFTLDAVRPGGELVLRPDISVGGTQVPLSSMLLVGRPAHGIAWWDSGPQSASGPYGLNLAALDTSVDERTRSMLLSPPVEVPDVDEERFFRDFYPRIERLVHVRSSDGTVELPTTPPSRLVLTLDFPDDQTIRLGWLRDAGGPAWRNGLWESTSEAHNRPAEDAIVAEVEAVVGSDPALMEHTLAGARRLAAEATLGGMDAVRFMTGLLPALRGIDGVEIVESGAAPDYREAVEPPVVSLGGMASGDRDWFDLTVSITVGDEDVPFSELFIALAEGRSHLILPSGTFFSLDRADLRQLAELIDEARSLQDGPGEGLRISRFQASLWEELRQLGVVTAQANEWESSVRALSAAPDRLEYPVPAGLHATLRPYQQTGFNWLAYLFDNRLGGVLADDMGLGKTIQALTLMCHTRQSGLTESPFLVVAPTSVVGNWADECRRFAPSLAVVALTETSARRGSAVPVVADGADLLVTSYSLFRLNYDEYAEVPWAGLFLDEAQFAKNRNSQAYQRAKLLPVPFKVAMTGTPIENNLMELWSLLSITAPGLFPSPDRFTEHYRVPIEKQSNDERLAQLRRRIRPLMLRRTKEQVAGDLPEKQEQILELELNPRHRKLYQTYLQRERQKVLGLLGDLNRNRFEIFRSLTLLRQASLDVSLIDPKHAKVPSTKLDALMEIMDDIVEDGHRVLVFSQFTGFLRLAQQRLQASGIDYCYLDGRTRKRQEVIAEFRSGVAPVFFISLKAGGFGLNLTEADYCIILDPWWNPATEAQAVDRIHRIGQTKKVMVYRLVAKDTIEEKVMALKARKAALFSNVMDGGGFETGAMTASDIQELLW